jgi:hypothetical protein
VWEREGNSVAKRQEGAKQAWEREYGCFGLREGAAAKQLFWHETRGCFGV